jgi:hypothetical protein
MLADLVSLGLLWLAYQNSQPMLAIPGLLGLFRHLASAVNDAAREKERARMSAIIAEAFEDRLIETPDFTLKMIGRAPSIVLLFRSPADARQAEDDGTLSKLTNQIRALHSMPVVLDTGSRLE